MFSCISLVSHRFSPFPGMPHSPRVRFVVLVFGHFAVEPAFEDFGLFEPFNDHSFCSHTQTISRSSLLGVKIDCIGNTQAVIEKGLSRLYFLRRLQRVQPDVGDLLSVCCGE